MNLRLNPPETILHEILRAFQLTKVFNWSIYEAQLINLAMFLGCIMRLRMTSPTALSRAKVNMGGSAKSALIKVESMSLLNDRGRAEQK